MQLCNCISTRAFSICLPSPCPQCDADQEVTRAAVRDDKYENILTLIGYYDIESRIPIRLLMLQVFGVLCGLDREIISVLLNSILPNELGRDINNHLTGRPFCCDLQPVFQKISDWRCFFKRYPTGDVFLKKSSDWRRFFLNISDWRRFLKDIRQR